MRKTELLLPAGGFDRLCTAFLYGADAVYAGTPDMSLRTKSSFDLDELVAGVEYAHGLGKKLYLTLNLFSHNKDVEKLPEYLEVVKKVNPDGLIIADPGVFNYVRKNAPHLNLHISTQANVSSSLTVNFWKELGADLCVLAREVTFAELAEIRRDCPDIKLETFVHGSMCMTYSGRCLLSNFLSERGANQGNCSHSCRWKYNLKMRLKDGTIKEVEVNDENRDLFEFLLEEEVRPGEFMPFEEDFDGSYILNSKDLCLMPKLDQYLKLGIDSLKVEGRNKTQYYVGVVGKAYRAAIDSYYENPEQWNYKPFMKELDTLANRGYTLAFHDGRLSNLAHNYDSTKSTSTYEFAGFIVKWEEDSFIFEAKNLLQAGDILEFVSPHQDEGILLRMYEFIVANKANQVFDKVHAGVKPQIRVPLSLFHNENPQKLRELLPVYTVIRKVKILVLAEEYRLKLDKEAQKIELEMSGASESKRVEVQNKLRDYMNKEGQTMVGKANLGLDGCCGKGCNGCLLFWHDDKYQKARDILRSKKQGVMLENKVI